MKASFQGGGDLRSFFLGMVGLIAVFLAVQVNGAAPQSTIANNAGSGQQASEKRNGRIREGTPLERQVGVFQSAGDRIVFVYGEQRLVSLENLALERVTQVVRDLPSSLQWTVDGIVTEYQGTNYLLVTKALIKRRRNATEEGF